MSLAFDEFGVRGNPPLVILHGFFASSRNWRSIAKALAERYHVLVPDLRNHGASPHDPEMDYPAMALDLKEFLERQGLQRPHLLGHSMGGKAAMWFALNSPQIVGKLIVADISPTRYRHSFDGTIRALRELPLQRIGNRRQADQILAGAIADSDYRQFLLQNLQLHGGEYAWRVDLDIFQQSADDIIAFPNVDGVSPYSGEALFLAGEHSNYVRKDDVNRWFPRARIVTLPGTGHWLHVQAPHQFCNEVNAFLT